MKFIGIAGKAGSGKTTAALFIGKVLGEGVANLAFADPLKKACSILTDIPESVFHPADSRGREYREKTNEFWGFSPREFLQKVGTDCMRDTVCKDFWVKRAHITVESLDPEMYHTVIFSDVRFQEELDFIRNKGGKVLYLTRIAESYNSTTHTSDNQNLIAECDYVINGNSSLKFLHSELELFLQKYL